MLKLIACIDENNSLGIDNDLIYRFKEDLKIFKEKTLNHTVVMGKNTFKSLNFNPLPKRNNIIISSSLKNPEDKTYEVLNNIDKIFELEKNEDIFIIGGKQIYEYFNDYYDELHLTIVKNEFTENYDVNKSVKLNIELNKFQMISSQNFEQFHICIYKRLP